MASIGMKSILLVSLAAVMLQSPEVQARMGGGRRKTTKKWNYYSEDENGLMGGRTMPCIGVCYYRKLLKLDELKKKYPNDPNPTLPTSTRQTFDPPCVGVCHHFRDEGKTTEEPSDDKPCVGLCQHYRELGLPNPFVIDLEADDMEEGKRRRKRK